MSDSKTAAQQVFDLVCEALTDENWKFDPDPEKLMIHTGAVGDDLPMDLFIDVNEKRDLLIVVSPMPLTVPEDKRVDFAIAVCAVNDRLASGGFDYDLVGGRLLFRLPNSFRGCAMSKAAALTQIMYTCNTADEYNDKFLMLAKGLLSLEQFLAAEEN